MPSARRLVRSGAAIAAAPLVAACIPLINNPLYPVDWPQLLESGSETCPAIAGTYANEGWLAVEAGVHCGGPRREGKWSCSLWLTHNLGLLKPAKVVRIEQPDAKTLSVTLLGEAGPPGETHVLTAGKDFKCASGRFQFSEARSMFDSAWQTALAATFMLTGGVLSHQRSFAPDVDGGLVMTVQESAAAWGVAIGTVQSSTSYVRWVKATPEDAAPGAAR